MKRFLIPLLVAIALPTAVNAEVTNDYLLKITECQNAYREGKFAEMKNIGEELIEIAPDRPNGYACKGIALGYYMSKNKNKIKREAIKDLTKAIEIDPEYYQLYFFRGAIQFSIKKPRDSEITTACSDIKKAYLANFPPALKFVKKNKSILRRIKCTGF